MYVLHICIRITHTHTHTHTHTNTHTHAHICIYESQAQHISQTLHAISHTLRGILARQGEAAADERSVDESAGESDGSDGAGIAGGGDMDGGGGGGGSGSRSCWQRKRGSSPLGLPHKIIRACGRWQRRYLSAGQSVSARSREAQGLGEVEGFVEAKGVWCRGGRWLGGELNSV